MNNSQQAPIKINSRQYVWPKQPLVVVCIDGSEPEYIDQAIAADRMPFTELARQRGENLFAQSVVPSFTNPNNLSIVTGVPPQVHGICGNFYYDRANDCEVMMNDPDLLRADTLLQAFHSKGAKVVVITAKDKLRRLLGHGLEFGPQGAICFSAEHADQANYDDNGIENVIETVGLPLPNVYSADLSEFIFAAAVKIMEQQSPDIMYLSTTDYIQHIHAPGSEVANQFYAMMDGYWAELDRQGATLALTADHGMNAKHDAAGNPNVVYLQDVLDKLLGEGIARVILPITDPYVLHHGALGSYATVYLPDQVDIVDITTKLKQTNGLTEILTRSIACERFQLPEDRVGELVLVSDRNTVIGTSVDRHDLSALTAPLRSHGGVADRNVPMIISQPVSEIPKEKQLYNYDVFDIALNYTVAI
ncbi:phosphonoacetate hydrolase [Pseudomonadota bacterium]